MGGWIIIHCKCLLHLEAFICRWRFCCVYINYCKYWGSAYWGAYVVLKDGFLGIIVAGVGMLDFSFSSLDRFFSWHMETLQRLLPMNIPTDSVEVFPFLQALLCFLFVNLWGRPFSLVGFDFLSVWSAFLPELGILCILSCSGGIRIFFFFVLFFLWVWGKYTSAKWLLDSCVWNLFSNPCPRTLPEGSCH